MAFLLGRGKMYSLLIHLTVLSLSRKVFFLLQLLRMLMELIYAFLKARV